jgi:hypothetical protein
VSERPRADVRPGARAILASNAFLHGDLAERLGFPEPAGSGD